MNNTINERITELRKIMTEQGISAYLIPTGDFHGSEYVGDFFKAREFMSGFTGSAGTLVVTGGEVCLWTDGRYFIQAEKELAGTVITLCKMGQEGVPSIPEYLNNILSNGAALGFDGRVVSYDEVQEILTALKGKTIKIVADCDLVGEIWENRPKLASNPCFTLGLEYAGVSRSRKIDRIRRAMAEKGADFYVLTSLDDICWLFNIRGGDVAYNPVVLSYVIISCGKTQLFIADEAVVPVKDRLEKDGVEVLPYDAFYDEVGKIPSDKTVYFDGSKVNFRAASLFINRTKTIEGEDLTLLPKAIKNKTEIANTKKAHLKDGVAVTKFIFWLKKNIGKVPLTEISVADKLEEFRRLSGGESYQGQSFAPIAAYGEHGAIVHYSADEASNAPIEGRSLLLLDTGGQYLEGTTDITRTIVCGNLTEEEKQCFTAVLRGNLSLMNAKFRYGCCGANLDYLARSPLWEQGLDYDHGTGHGVGHFLNVHEGPNGFRYKDAVKGNKGTVFEAGMITSDEPGFYSEGKFGIRLENLLICVEKEVTDYGHFLGFEPLTLVPFDLDALVPEVMTSEELELLNDYHSLVFEKLAPYMSDEELAWLRLATGPLTI